jgi:hypothetical protein
MYFKANNNNNNNNLIIMNLEQFCLLVEFYLGGGSTGV